MAEKGIWESHDLLADRTVKVAGQTYVHRHCQRCGRDFAIPPGERNWHAVHVGVFNFLLLDEPRNREWLSERCPGRPPAD